MSNINAFQFTSNKSAVNTFISIVVGFLNDGTQSKPLPTSSVNITKVDNIVSVIDKLPQTTAAAIVSKVVRGFELSSVPGIIVSYNVSLIAEEVGFSSGQEAYSVLANKLEVAVQSQQFTSALQSSSVAVFDSTAAINITVAAPEIIIERTAAPSRMPSFPSGTQLPSLAASSLSVTNFYGNFSLAG